MNLGKAKLKLTVSHSHRRLALGVNHGAAAGGWQPPSKDPATQRKR